MAVPVVLVRLSLCSGAKREMSNDFEIAEYWWEAGA